MTPPRVLALVFAGMGATAASVGPLLPVLAARLDTSPAVLSLATSFLFGGLVVGVVVAVVATRRLAVGPVLMGGAAIQAVALLGLALAPSAATVHAAALLLGTGFGASEVTAAVVAGRGAGGSARLAMLTAVFAAAAIATPVLLGTSVTVTGSVALGTLVVVVLHATAVAAVLTIRSWFVQPDPDLFAPPHASVPAPQGRRAVMATTAVLVAYVGAEATLTTWSGELARTLLGLSAGAAAFAPTAFWVCLLAGRIVAARLLQRFDPRRVLLASLGAGATAALASASVASVSGLLALVLVGITGVAMGPVYGVTLSFGAQPTGGTPMARTGLLIGVGAVGGATVPAFVAVVAETGPAAVAAAVGAFLVVAGMVASRIPRRAPAVASVAEPG